MTEERSILNSAPTVSIIMGAYNAASTIREALDSIVAQTFTDWEFIICDDSSSDDTLEICNAYVAAHPGRFQVLTNERNMKLSATLNRCLSVARGKFIARMDADDLSIPERLATQVVFLESHPDVDLVGSSMQRFDQAGLGSLVLPPEWPDRDTLRHAVPFCHATILARREVYERIGGYNESPRSTRGQDIDLWFNFYRLEFVGINLLEPLYMVREDTAAIRRRTAKVRWNSFLTMVNGYRMLGYPVYCYLVPTLQLGKALVPFQLQQRYRRWQAHRSEVGVA